MCLFSSLSPRFEKVRQLVDGKDTFFVVLAHDLKSYAIQQAQIVFFFSLVETGFPERTDRAMDVDNNWRRMGRKIDFPRFENVDNRFEFCDQLR